jgi:hypothetical protein
MANRYFARDFPHAQIGVVCGPSNLAVIDIDPKNSGDVTLRRFVFDLGGAWFDDCPQVITPSGGAHLWFRAPDRAIHGGTNALGVGIDVLGGPRVIMAPPSRGSAATTFGARATCRTYRRCRPCPKQSSNALSR